MYNLLFSRDVLQPMVNQRANHSPSNSNDTDGERQKSSQQPRVLFQIF